MSPMPGKKGRSGAPGVSKAAGPGRAPKGARIEVGAPIFVSETTTEGAYTDIGRGKVVEVVRSGTDRILVIERADGRGKIRLLVVGN